MERSKRIRETDIEITHIKAGGPGGQHRNKRMTGIRATHRPTGIVVEATERRSQQQNLRMALDRLAQKVARHLFRPKRRLATRPTAASHFRRQEGKSSQSKKKGLRKKVGLSFD